jgi:hypothetical protein
LPDLWAASACKGNTPGDRKPPRRLATEQGRPAAARPVSPKDLAATLYHLLGIDPFQDYQSLDGRPYKMLDEGEVIRELV